MDFRVPLHVPEPLAGTLIAQPFWFKYPERKGSVLFDKHLPQSFFETDVEFVTAENAKAIVLPHDFSRADTQAHSYIATYADLGERLGIPVFIFCLGDLVDLVRFDPRVYVFRQSVYRGSMSPQDIVMPTLVSDAGAEGVTFRPKAELPTVSFCGQAGYNAARQWLGYYIKIVRYTFTPARRLGVYWRRRMLSVCRRSPLVKTNFIIRNSFSGAHRTIELPPEQARKEFVDSIIESDFVLAPKGDGNYSNRFLEALALGRVPVLLDTEAVLPLEDEIEYGSVVVRVPMEAVTEAPRLIREFYDALSEEEWRARQQQAREIFETRLRLDSFFKHFFATVVSRLPSHLPGRSA